jgi:hypothetical protein
MCVVGRVVLGVWWCPPVGMGRMRGGSGGGGRRGNGVAQGLAPYLQPLLH